MGLFRRRRQRNVRRSDVVKEIPSKALEENEKDKLTGSIESTVLFMQDMLGDSDDFVVKHFQIFGRFRAVLFYVKNIADSNRINNEILKSLMYVPEHLMQREWVKQEMLNILVEETLYDSQTNREQKLDQLINVILRGETVIVMEGQTEAIHIDTRMIEKRSIKSPETEQAILGSRESFIESIATNIALIRARLPTPDLCIKTMEIGRLTKSKVSICYMKGIADVKLIKEVEKRLSEIDIDVILDVGYIEQFIEDNPFSPFPQTQSTERPDKTVANLAEGRVAILVDGSPFSLIVPVVFNQFYQTFDDYSSRFLMGSFARLARMLALVFSLIFPSLYVSFISFNPELLPTEFAVAVAGGRAGVPYPAVIEVLIIEVAMEVLREATVRMPKQVGGALSIVGVLVVGEAAVNAGLASPITVVVIALTSIGSFATPAYVAAFALRMLRFPILFLAGIFGLYGVVIGIIFIFNHMLSLKSFGVPYMSPVSPGNSQGLKDIIIRSPLWWMSKRPVFLHPSNRDRLGEVKNKVLQHSKVGNDQREEAQNGGDKRGHNGSSGDNPN
ncbi:spore germination protein [Bacillus tuaregi]|uniref:spore germination protein n=1 Tax=Bacillus tuaregi TaxID=1816695 RepID=UPI0008F8017A|nr:spore germination protein [Bacillus tuaregi]